VIVVEITLRKQFRTEFQNQKPIHPETVRTPHNFHEQPKIKCGSELARESGFSADLNAE
jgi:hypothetical protein